MSKLSGIFTVSGCLKIDAIYAYKAGKCSETVNAQIKVHLENCPLCREAIEAADSVPKKDVQTLSASIASRIPDNSFNKFSKARYWMAAATLALILSSIFIWRSHINTPVLSASVADSADNHRAAFSHQTRNEIEPNHILNKNANDTNGITQDNGILHSAALNKINTQKDTLLALDENLAKPPEQQPDQIEDIKSKTTSSVDAFVEKKVKSEVLSFYPVKNYGHLGTKDRVKHGNAYLSVIDRKGYVDVALPSYPGGTTGLETYIDSALAEKLGHVPTILFGRTAIVSFVVNRRGVITNIEFQNELSEQVNASISNILHEMPKWKKDPKGGRGRVRYTISIRFPQNQQPY